MFSIILCTILLLVFAMIFVGCDFFNAGVNNSTPDMGQNDNNDCTHTSTRWITDEEATCTTDGSKHKECSSCGKTLDTESISKGHDYYELVVPPTEEQQGYTLHYCSRCNDSYKDNFVDPSVGENPPVGEYTEAEYKAMFETNILAAIQNEYNEDTPVENFFLHDLELELVNYGTGDVYFTCERNNQKVMFIANHEEITEWATYEALYENCPTDGFEFSYAYTVQEDDIAQEFVEFAMTQKELQAYIQDNNLDLSSYTVINVTERNFYPGDEHGVGGYMFWRYIILIEEGVFTFDLKGDGTGYCSTQKGYLEKLKEIVTEDYVKVINMSIVEYYEIPAATE